MSCGNVVTITGSQCDNSELRYNEREDTARTVQSIDSEPGHTSGSGRQRRHGLNGTRSAENSGQCIVLGYLLRAADCRRFHAHLISFAQFPHFLEKHVRGKAAGTVGDLACV